MDFYAPLVVAVSNYDPANIFNFPQSIPTSLTKEDARRLNVPESMTTEIISATPDTKCYER